MVCGDLVVGLVCSWCWGVVWGFVLLSLILIGLLLCGGCLAIERFLVDLWICCMFGGLGIRLVGGWLFVWFGLVCSGV